ncbi:MAG: DUF2017 domain-containing protein [Actinomycetales bacterium]
MTPLQLQLSEADRALLTTLTRQLVALLDAQDEPPSSSADPLAALVGSLNLQDPESSDRGVQRPEDQVLARLLPDGYRDDDEAAADFRRFTESDLRRSKSDAAQRVLQDLAANRDPIALDDSAVTAWLGCLNDLRLGLGTRIGITEENLEELSQVPDSDPRLPMLQVYDWLTYLQGSLVELLLPEE